MAKVQRVIPAANQTIEDEPSLPAIRSLKQGMNASVISLEPSAWRPFINRLFGIERI